jgi:hypothetical protein
LSRVDPTKTLTPAELALEKEKVNKARIKKKMISQLIKMQYMWIPMHRMSEKDIRALDDKQLHVQYKMHSKLWEDYINKPVAPETCGSCGIQVGKAEVLTKDEDGKLVYDNEFCRECALV